MGLESRDLTGQRFGRWIVLSRIDSDMIENAKWKVRCDCGKERTLTARALVYGGSTSCGCERRERLTQYDFIRGVPGGKNFKDITNKKFGKLTAIKPTRQNQKREWFWSCQCECGNISEVKGSHLRSGRVVSCGCLRSECPTRGRYKHGLTYTADYVRQRNRKRERAESFLDAAWNVEMEVLIRCMFNRCVVCGCTELDHFEQTGQHLHIDHVQPLVNGNGLKPGNAVILCRKCNAFKHAKDLSDLPTEWRDKIVFAADLFEKTWHKHLAKEEFFGNVERSVLSV